MTCTSRTLRRWLVLVVQVDSREKTHIITDILKQFEEADVQYVISKLYVGDYMIYGHPEIVVDRKHNLAELAGNVTKEHDRFAAELTNAKAVGTKIIILVEDGNIQSLEDVKTWKSRNTKVKGEVLFKILSTMLSETDKYDFDIKFCKKTETGKEIIKILKGE
jgi:ERCC4-type nuclease